MQKMNKSLYFCIFHYILCPKMNKFMHESAYIWLFFRFLHIERNVTIVLQKIKKPLYIKAFQCYKNITYYNYYKSSQLREQMFEKTLYNSVYL